MEVLRDKELDRYYQERFLTTGSKGWEDLMGEVQVLLDGYNSLDAATNLEQLYFRKGQVDILKWILSVGPLSRQAYDELLEQEQEQNDESL